MKCVTCGHEAAFDFRFCPECGAEARLAQDEVRALAAESVAAPVAASDAAPAAVSASSPDILKPTGSASHPTAYVRADYDPTRDGHWRQQAAVSPPPGAFQPAIQPSFAGSYQSVAPVQQTSDRNGASSTAVADSEPRPSTTAQIVIASINIIFVGLGVSFILGIIALVFTIMASGEAAVAEASSKLRTAKTLNIIGLVFLGIQLLLIILLITAGIVMFASIFTQTGPTFGGDYPLG